MSLLPLPVLLFASFACSPASEVPQPVPIQVVVAPQGAVEVPGQGLVADLARTQDFHATRPVYERPLGVGTQIPVGLTSLSAESCGVCHEAIYDEWRVSTHAAAWTDRQYQVEIAKSDNRWLCLNCHSPLLTQQDVWPVGLIDDDVERPQLVPNPVFDAALRDEGITCAGCHVREGVVHGPGLGGAAPHPVQADPDYTNGGLCLRCHQAVATYAGKTFTCVFDTGSEWASSPWAAEGATCQTCHMPAVQRPAATGGPERTVGQHYWRGAGIAKVEGVHPPVEANPPGLALTAVWQADGIVVEATNARAGHRLPTGDPERWVQVDVTLYDAEGSALSAMSTRFGQEWTWWPEPVKHGDTRLAPRETRSWTVALPKGAVRATVVASSHRMTQQIADYHGLTGYPLSIETHRIELAP